MAKAKRTCSFPDCDRPVAARGWCRAHYNRWYYAGAPDGVNISTRTDCARCGGETPTRPSGPRPTYCSSKCKSAVSYERSKVTGSYQRGLARSRKAATERSCVECGQVYSSNRDGSIYCSSGCTARARDKSGHPCSVEGCGRGVRAHGICNTHHKRVLRAEGKMREPWDDRRRNNNHIRRARKGGVSGNGRAWLADIVARDGSECGWCGEDVDLDLAHPDMMSKSVDHVIPISRGGAHLLSNVQLMHLRCNLSKGARAA